MVEKKNDTITNKYAEQRRTQFEVKSYSLLTMFASLQ